MIKLLIPLLLASLIYPLSAQQMKLEVIPLNHGTTEQVIEVVRPLLVPGGTITGMNNQLIIKTTPENLNEIKNVLSAIDKPLRRLMITVAQDSNSSSGGLRQSVSGNIRSGDVSVSNSASVQNRGITISGNDSDGNTTSYRVLNNRINNTDNNTYSLQALEGQPAFIQSGLSVPIQNQNTVITRNGVVVVQDTLEYRDVTSGFYVLPRINGDRVTLMVAPQLASVNQGSLPTFNIQNVQTTVTGRLGEWLEIGGLDQSSQGNRQSILSGSSRQRQESRTILIKVEEIR